MSSTLGKEGKANGVLIRVNDGEEDRRTIIEEKSINEAKAKGGIGLAYTSLQGEAKEVPERQEVGVTVGDDGRARENVSAEESKGQGPLHIGLEVVDLNKIWRHPHG